VKRYQNENCAVKLSSFFDTAMSKKDRHRTFLTCVTAVNRPSIAAWSEIRLFHNETTQCKTYNVTLTEYISDQS